MRHLYRKNPNRCNESFTKNNALMRRLVGGIQIAPHSSGQGCKHCIIGYMDLRPLHDRVLVKRLEQSEERRGGIIIPDSAKEKPQQAEVKAVGSGKLLESGERAAVEVKAGDRILFGKYSGSEIKIDGNEYLILKEDEILAVVE
jgi:chaperonin GroES